MAQRVLNTSFWTDSWVEELDPTEKLIFIYLLTNPLCNIAWCYEIKTKRIAYETGYEKEMVEKILKRFEESGKIVRHDDWIVIVNFIKNQAKNPKVETGIRRIVQNLPKSLIDAVHNSLCIAYGYPIDRLSHFTLLNYTNNSNELLDIPPNFENWEIADASSEDPEESLPLSSKDKKTEESDDSLNEDATKVPSHTSDELFAQFWHLYPRKIDKKKALSRWRQLSNRKKMLALEALPKHIRSWLTEWREKSLIPHATTWLSWERWNDDLDANLPDKSVLLRQKEAEETREKAKKEAEEKRKYDEKTALLWEFFKTLSPEKQESLRQQAHTLTAKNLSLNNPWFPAMQKLRLRTLVEAMYEGKQAI